MTWHETIEFIRNKAEYKSLVEQAYFEEDLTLNVDRFKQSEEFQETLRLIRKTRPAAKTILEIGAGNGIACINLAVLGYGVTAVEPDDSSTVGAGAIKRLAQKYKLDNLEVIQSYAEEIGFADESFDVVYIRQAMHHAYDLKKFVLESARVLKPGGLLLTIRDHVIFNEDDKKWFLQEHPLHKFYGGENAFTSGEYRAAIEEAGLEILQEMKHFDSVINYFPLSSERFINQPLEREREIEERLKSKIGILGKIGMFKKLYKKRVGFDIHKFYDESRIAGRMYSYISVKK
jgi:ubiquinone/menaquinone biosynthesis C-methylase UbiE